MTNMMRAMRLSNVLLISNNPLPNGFTNDDPADQSFCNILISRPTVFRSSSDKPRNHLRTGSLPDYS